MCVKTSSRKTLSKTVLEQRPPSTGRIEIRDTDSLLTFRLTAKGRRSLSIRTRVNGEQVRLLYPEAAIIANLPAARIWALEQIAACKKGRDPRAVAKAEVKATRIAAARSERRIFENVMDAYLKEEVRGRKNNRSADQSERRLELYVKPRWKGRQITDISRGDVHALLNDVRDSKIECEGGGYCGGPVIVNRVLAVIRAMFNWWQIQDEAFVSPIVKGMAKGRETRRNRVLTDRELHVLWSLLPGFGVFGSIVEVLLLTAQRKSEVTAMARGEISGGDVWTIPAERYKTGTPNIVPLTVKARSVVNRQDRHKDCDLVFSTNGKTAFSGFGKSKCRLDDAMLAALRAGAPEPGKVTLAPWRLHDLRRTAKTLMQRAGVRPDISERVLGHIISGVEGTYDRYDYLEEKRDALERLEKLLDRIVNPVSNVISFEMRTNWPHHASIAVRAESLRLTLLANWA
jgi:integrase